MTTAIKTPADINALLTSGDVAENLDKNEVTITTKTAGEVKVTYRRFEAVTLAGALALVGGNESDVIKAFNYGYDLKRRAQVRAAEESKYVDPSKADDKAVKNLVATGLYTESEARAMLEAKRAKANA